MVFKTDNLEVIFIKIK